MQRSLISLLLPAALHVHNELLKYNFQLPCITPILHFFHHVLSPFCTLCLHPMGDHSQLPNLLWGQRFLSSHFLMQFTLCLLDAPCWTGRIWDLTEILLVTCSHPLLVCTWIWSTGGKGEPMELKGFPPERFQKQSWSSGGDADSLMVLLALPLLLFS